MFKHEMNESWDRARMIDSPRNTPVRLCIDKKLCAHGALEWVTKCCLRRNQRTVCFLSGLAFRIPVVPSLARDDLSARRICRKNARSR